MYQFEIEPLVGIGPIRFGQTRLEVRETMAGLGAGELRIRSPETDCFFESSFQVSYGETERVEFIETAYCDLFRALFKGKILHEMEAQDAVAFVSKYAEFDRDDPELGYTYTFPSIEFALWRAVIPENKMGHCGRTFESVAIGKKEYYSEEGPV